MSIENIEIKTTEDKFFLQYLTLKRPIINIILTKINHKPTFLHDIPMHVLAELLWLNHKYDILAEDEKWKKVFNKDSKGHITKKLNMTDHKLNVYFYQLRKIKILNGRKINRLFIVKALDHNLSFKFIFNGENGKSVDKKDNT